jgi:hypothetical protein
MYICNMYILFNFMNDDARNHEREDFQCRTGKNKNFTILKQRCM